MVQWVKTSITKPDDVPGNHITEGENVPQIVLWLPYVLHSTCNHRHLHTEVHMINTQIINIIKIK